MFTASIVPSGQPPGNLFVEATGHGGAEQPLTTAGRGEAMALTPESRLTGDERRRKKAARISQARTQSCFYVVSGRPAGSTRPVAGA